MSSFQIARGYAPSVLGIPPSRVTQELLTAHREMSATRALQKLLNSHDNHFLPPSALTEDTNIWVYYRTSAQNEHPRWVKVTAIEALTHFVKCRRLPKGPPMTIAYDYIRLVPQRSLARELQESVLKDVLENCNTQKETIKHEKSLFEKQIDSD